MREQCSDCQNMPRSTYNAPILHAKDWASYEQHPHLLLIQETKEGNERYRTHLCSVCDTIHVVYAYQPWNDEADMYRRFYQLPVKGAFQDDMYRAVGQYLYHRKRAADWLSDEPSGERDVVYASFSEGELQCLKHANTEQIDLSRTPLFFTLSDWLDSPFVSAPNECTMYAVRIHIPRAHLSLWSEGQDRSRLFRCPLFACRSVVCPTQIDVLDDGSQSFAPLLEWEPSPYPCGSRLWLSRKNSVGSAKSSHNRSGDAIKEKEISRMVKERFGYDLFQR